MASSVSLVPLQHVERCGTGFRALSDDPWLALETPALHRTAGRFVTIVYRASLWDEPARPVFRFETADGRATERIAPGPVAGAGVWTGRIPAGTVRAAVSPTPRAGRFDFVVETIRERSWLGLVAEGMRRNPRSARSAVLTRFIGWAPESDVNLAWAIGATTFERYPAWRDARRRPLDRAEIDAPRCNWNAAPPVHLTIDARAGTDGLAATLDSLLRQIYPRWTATVFAEAPLALPDDPRFDSVGAAPDAIAGALQPGTVLLPHALACLIEAADRHPTARLFYGDEELASAAGDRPDFKPGWSAVLAAQRSFFGQAAFHRTGMTSSGEDAAPVALRRVIARAPAEPPPRPGRSPAPSPDPGPFHGAVAVIIPTRDQPARLERAVAGIRRLAGCLVPPRIVVVDNGSVAPEATRLLAALQRDGDVTVLDRPEPFNFSALCNAGAACAADADVYVFCNDDTEAVTSGWLDRLAAWATRPATGAVGALLTYPDGRVQHAGVLVGMGESAGHFGAFAQPGEPGWAGWGVAVREVSAVTGACLAVARDKFEAVGGFDAVNLPIELSDIDLCLMLAERGWGALIDPAVRLVHEESVSRGGATFRRSAVYESQRAHFRAKWRLRLRDDPFFHPGLSLFGWTATLA